MSGSNRSKPESDGNVQHFIFMKHVFIRTFIRNGYSPSSTDFFCQRFVLGFNIPVNCFVMPEQNHRYLGINLW